MLCQALWSSTTRDCFRGHPQLQTSRGCLLQASVSTAPCRDILRETSIFLLFLLYSEPKANVRKSSPSHPHSPPWGREFCCCLLTEDVSFWAVLSFLGFSDLTFLFAQAPSFAPVCNVLPSQGTQTLRVLGVETPPGQSQLQASMIVFSFNAEFQIHITIQRTMQRLQ